jgi:hypothetical protein
MILAGIYVPPPLLAQPSNRPATLAVEDRGMAAILAACEDPAAALDTIMADTFGRAYDEPSN